MAETTTDSAPNGEMPPPAPGAGGARPDEHSGLHDIKALAQTTKRRISQRVSTQSDVEDSLLGSSSAALSTVMLPMPGKDEARYETERNQVSTATRAPATAVSEERASSSGLPVWLFGAVGAAVVAAGVAFFVLRGSGGEPAAGAGSAPATPQPVVTGSASAKPTAAVTPLPVPTEAAETGDPGAATDEADGALAADEPEDDAPASTDPAGDEPAATAAAATAPEPAQKPERAAREVASKPAPKAPSNPATGKSEPAGKAKAEPAPAQADSGGHSLDDLLAEASGGAAAPEASEKPEAAAAPTKESLGRADVKKAMNSIVGRVGACQEKSGETGIVKIRFTVAPSGEVTKADAQGKFQLTDLGNCIADAVRSARFPAYAGRPQSFTYPFLLTQ